MFQKVLLIWLLLINLAKADNLLENSNYCTSHFGYFEQLHSMPSKLLNAVSLTESGIWHNLINKSIPWPWAVNFKGVAHYYNTKQQAIEAVSKLLNQGHRSIDVGCMQINLHFHPTAFQNLEQAFEPYSNIKYAADFLKYNFKKHNNWHSAIAAYHSERPEFGIPYAYRVINHWQRLLNPDIKIVKTNQKYDFSSLNKKNRSPVMSNSRIKSELFIKIQKQVDINHNEQQINNITKSLLKSFNKQTQLIN